MSEPETGACDRCGRQRDDLRPRWMFSSSSLHWLFGDGARREVVCGRCRRIGLIMGLAALAVFLIGMGAVAMLLLIGAP